MLDFDGTIARDDVLDPTVWDAIAELRAQGIVVLLATGRILEDLRRVAAELLFVVAVLDSVPVSSLDGHPRRSFARVGVTFSQVQTRHTGASADLCSELPGTCRAEQGQEPGGSGSIPLLARGSRALASRCVDSVRLAAVT